MNIRITFAVHVRYLALALFFSAIPLLACRAGSLEEIRDQASDITAVHARFVQEKHLDILDKPLVSNGVFYFRAPDLLRWEYTDPVQSLLIMDSEKIRQYISTDSGMQVRQDQSLEAMRVFLERICTWVQGGFDQDPAFDAELVSGRKVVLTPSDKAVAAVIEKIELLLTDTPGVIESATIYEDAASYTRIVFHETRINPEIPEAVFDPDQ